MPGESIVDSDSLQDAEIVYLRVPPFPPFHSPENWLTTANFKLDPRRDEEGLSVYCGSIRTPQQVLGDPNVVPGSFLVSASVGEIRKLKNGAGAPLGLNVFACDDAGRNPGHAEIRPPIPRRLTSAASKALRDLFASSGRVPVR